MKLPLNGKWIVDQSTDRGLGILATKNIQFDRYGYATLANRTASVFNEVDESTFRVPIALYQAPNIVKTIGTSGAPDTINLTSIPYNLTLDGLTNQPTGNSNSSQEYFINKWFIAMNNDLRSYDGSAWTDETATVTSGVRHPLCLHKGNNTLLMGNGNQVKQFNTGISETTNLSLPSGIEVVGIAYNRNFAAVVTWDALNREAWLFIWDGATAAANYAYPLGANRALFVAPYKDTFVTINALGQVLIWDTAGLKQIGALPSYFTSAILASIDNRIDIAHDTSIIIDGEKILFQIRPIVAYKNSETDRYNPDMPAGIWCWDPNVGLYHRHAPSGAKLVRRLIAAGSVNTGTDIVTMTATVPATGTPFMFVSSDSLPIVPLVEQQIYYVIKLSATTFSIAATRALAAAGTAIDLTSAPSGSSYGFIFWPESDYGQLGFEGYAGIIAKTGPQGINTSTSNTTVFEKYVYGHLDVPINTPVSDVSDSLGIVMDRGENRGWIKTQKAFSAHVTEIYQKLFVKARHMIGVDDKIVVKYRAEDDFNMPVIARSSGVIGTWTVVGAAASTFTTAADLTNVKTAFDAGKFYELEVIAGAGSGYLAHITAMSVAAGVWTVVVDEPLRNVAVNDTFHFVIDNFQKLSTARNVGYMDSTNDPNYSEFPISKYTKWVQFKIELRGFKVALEEYELVNSGDKPAV